MSVGVVSNGGEPAQFVLARLDYIYWYVTGNCTCSNLEVLYEK